MSKIPSKEMIVEKLAKMSLQELLALKEYVKTEYEAWPRAGTRVKCNTANAFSISDCGTVISKANRSGLKVVFVKLDNGTEAGYRLGNLEPL
jgi:hypothetical protein